MRPAVSRPHSSFPISPPAPADTTRSPRAGESDGKEYHFVPVDEFKRLHDSGAFIESAEFSGNFYATSFAAVRAVSSNGRRCILDIESQVRASPPRLPPSHRGFVPPAIRRPPPAQGVRQVKKTDLKPVYLFLSPPSLPALRARLIGRGTETDAAVQKRLTTALNEIAYAKEGAHDVVIVNDNIDRAYDLLKRVALGEKIEGDQLPPLDS